jgi:hypothetical protein
MAALVPAPAWSQEPKPQEPKPQENCPRGAVGDIPDSLRIVQDETDGTTFYRHQSSPPGPGEEAFFLYIGKKACEVWLRIRIQFPGNKPSGSLRIRIKADDKSYEFPARHLSQSEDPNTRGYWYDELVDPDHLLMLFKVAASARASVRLESAAGADEHIVSDREKQALTIVLGAYHSLGGKLSSHAPVRGDHAVATADREVHPAQVAQARKLRAHRTPAVRLGPSTPPESDRPAVFS